MRLSPVQCALMKRLAEGAELHHRPPRLPSSSGDYVIKDARGRIVEVITRRTVEILAEQMEGEAETLRELVGQAKAK